MPTATPTRTLGTRAALALDAIERLASTPAPTAQATLEELLRRIVAVVPIDGFFMGATDPVTGLCLGAGMVYDYPHAVCTPFWEHEFLVPDFNKSADMGACDPVADLRTATGGRFRLSARARMMRELTGYEEEVRVVLYDAGACWGKLQLNRAAGHPPFTAGELAFLRSIAPLGGRALRRALLDEPAPGSASSRPAGRGAGVVIVDEDGGVIDINGAADAWLEELASGWRKLDSDLRIHPELLVAALSAADDGRGRARLRTADGVWLTAQASRLGGSGQVALVIEPSKASEILPVVIEAYALTRREVDVTRLVASGRSTPEIAAVLHLSHHTVRDHLKAIFEKVGVSSRGELTARLFAEHHAPALDAAITGAGARFEMAAA